MKHTMQLNTYVQDGLADKLEYTMCITEKDANKCSNID